MIMALKMKVFCIKKRLTPVNCQHTLAPSKHKHGTKMYRASDKEIEVVAQVLKDWLMPSGWTTAAVIALHEAAKVRAPKKMKKADDSQMLKFLDGVVGVIEANSNEHSHIWERFTNMHGKAAWDSDNSGLLETVGYLDERPICISLRTAKLKGAKILFWHATSQLVDHKLIDE